MIIPWHMYFVVLTHCTVNVHVNTRANGNRIKAVREGSVILPFEKATNTNQRKSAKSNRRVLKRISRPDVFRDRNQIINYCEFLLRRFIETNPRPPVLILVATMCRNVLTALIFNHKKFICLSEDLIEIMNTGNNIRLFHSHLSKPFCW